ncbi:hypothetical protein [Microbacterium sulfonylureivorans]|uniref:hypothetical protein n=1 Tax=Microbacterium sulfonylureivorans TaxID=2486854 RepID=UPI000FD9B020|nr:hypothetical protein [Microbacterium sulfonylureivorans]
MSASQDPSRRSTAPAPSKRPAFEPAARLLKPTAYDPDMRRPISIVAGTALVLLRVVAGVLVVVGLAIGWDDLMADPGTVLEGFATTPEGQQAALWVLVGVYGTILLADLLLAVFVYRGRNWARVIVMLFTVVSISTTFVAWWAQGQEIALEGAFVSLAIDILVLLALSSRSAAAYARRNQRR